MTRITYSPGTCPADIDVTAEAYVMKRLSPVDAVHFANHCSTCRSCAAAAEASERFVRDIKAAARRLRAEPRKRIRLLSRVSFACVTTLPTGNIRARMRFEVATCDPPRS